MPRIRTIKPEFFTSLTVAGLPLSARLTFIGLWTHVDDSGVCVDDVRLVRAAIWPLDDRLLSDVDADLKALDGVRLIDRYSVGERSYIAVVGWAEHQKINRPTVSKFPGPGLATSRRSSYLTSIDGQLTEPSVSPHGLVSEDSLRAHADPHGDTPGRDASPHPGIPGLTSIDGQLTEPSRRERKGKERKGTKTPPTLGQESMDLGTPHGDPSQHMTLDQHWGKFWNTFPRRKEPRTARAAWDRARKRAPIDVIQAGAERYARELAGQELKFSKYPTTWLNGDCWADDPEDRAAARDMYGRPQQPPVVHPDGSLDADAILGADRWQLPPPPDGVRAGTTEFRTWARTARDDHAAERQRQAREAIERRNA